MTKRTVVIFYYATYCKDCAGEEYVLEQLAEEFPDLEIQRVNILDHTASEIKKVPEFVITTEEGKVILNGFQSLTELEAVFYYYQKEHDAK